MVHIAHAILSIVLIAGLLASGSPCGWLCGEPSTPPASADAQTRCHADAQPTAPTPAEPCEEDCAGCVVSSTPIPASGFVAGTADGAEFTIVLRRQPTAALRQNRLSHKSLRLTDRSPPIDILATTSSLRL